MSNLRDPKLLVELIIDTAEAEDGERLANILEVLLWERKHPPKGFKQGTPHHLQPELDYLVREVAAKQLISGAVTTEVEWASKFAKTDAEAEKSKVSAAATEDDKVVMTPSQELAWDKLVKFLAGEDLFFTLRGYAGTGKSFMMKRLSHLPYNFFFSAPTNKATKVLSQFIGMNCKTTYSLLGIKMVNNEDRKELGEMSRIPDLGSKPVLVIDEAGMIPKFMADIIKNISEEFGWRVIFVGDPAQLNPVKESRSIVWGFPHREHRALLTDVKRFDNELLHLSVFLRECLIEGTYPRAPIKNNNDGHEGIFVIPRPQFVRRLATHTLEDWKTTKVACWRNKTVAEYTKLIRDSLGFKNEFDEGDLIMMASPVMGEHGTILAYIDEEFQIKSITSREFEFDEGRIEAKQIVLHDSQLVLYVPEDVSVLEDMLSRRSSKASKAPKGVARKLAWDHFWKLKEQFHSIRHGYAMTTYRLQGTTLDQVYVDQSDILANPNERESFRHLYVAATRPRFKLVTF